MSDQTNQSRRRALALLGCAGATGVLAVGAGPAIALSVAPSRQSDGSAPWFPIAKLLSVPEGKPVRFKVVGDLKDGFTNAKQQALGLVWVVKNKDQVQAFSATCPHLGCTVDIGADGKSFYCPCHSSSFELNGDRTPGKPNQSLRGLDPITVRITGDKDDRMIEVQFKRFKLGTEERTELA